MKNRSRSDIIASVLDSANGEIMKSDLMRQANLTTAQFNDYVTLLIRKGLLTEIRSRKSKTLRYKTTGLGMKYISLYQAIKITPMLGEIRVEN